MKVQWGVDRALTRPSCLALGVFDGVHVGHRRVISAAVRQAVRRGIVPAVLTFDPHPAAVVGDRVAPPLLTTTDEKIALLRELGVELAVIARFDPVMAQMSPEDFIADILLERLRARCVVVGADWRFGAGGRGTAELLKCLSGRYGFGARTVAPVIGGGEPVSSTRIRALLSAGRIGDANRLLARPYSLEGPVVPGDGLGRRLGFPTANLAVPAEKLIPADGIYACLASSGKSVSRGRRAARRLWPAVAYVGARPTIGRDGPKRVEVHLLERRGPVGAPGSVVRVALVSRLRPDRRFSTAEALAAQIALDCRQATRVLALHRA